MKKWFVRKYIEFKAAVFHAENEKRKTRLPLEDKLDDYADAQIATLLLASREYLKAKKDPDAFIEKYFSAKIKPVVPYTDSWVNDFIDPKPPADQSTISPLLEITENDDDEWDDDYDMGDDE